MVTWEKRRWANEFSPMPRPPNCTVQRSWRGSGFRHDSDLFPEGDEARVVLVGAQERIVQQHGPNLNELAQSPTAGLNVGELLLQEQIAYA